MISSEQKKTYISYKKIATFRQGMSTTEKGMVSSTSYTVFAFEREDGIIFSCRQGVRCAGNGRSFGTKFAYKLRLRTLKNGEKRFIFYKFGDRSPRTVSPNVMRSSLFTLVQIVESRKKNSFLNYEKMKKGLYKAQMQRLSAFLKGFLRKHNISTKNLSKDPFSLMVQLCYPGTRQFDEETLTKISTGKFLLDDPVKLALRTKGKKSRRLVYNTIKISPVSAQTMLRMAKYLRVNRSLDDAQKFIECFYQRLIEPNQASNNYVFADSSSYRLPIYRLSAKQLRYLNNISIESIVRALESPQLIEDTFLMINRLTEDQEQNLKEMQCRSIQQLHYSLVQILQINTNRGRKKSQFSHFSFDLNSVPMEFCELVSSTLSDDKFKFSYAKGTTDLESDANKLGNCAFYAGYYKEIQAGRYAILNVDNVEEHERYMLGFEITGNKVNRRYVMDQAEGVRWSRIEKSTFDTIVDKLKQITQLDVSPTLSYRYNHLS